MIDNTEWFEIGGRFTDYPNYKVSKDGRVKTFSQKRCILKSVLHHRGYYVVSLVNTSKKLKIQAHIHQLVATAFLGDPPSIDHTVNHKDGVKTNNNIDNLEYITFHENSTHASQMGLYKVGSENGKAKLTEDQVIDIKLMLRLGIGNKVISDGFGVTPETIGDIKKGRSWKHLEFGDTL